MRPFRVLIALGLMALSIDAFAAGPMQTQLNGADIENPIIFWNKLGGGTAGKANTGTAGHVLPYLDGNNDFSGTLKFSGLGSGTQVACLGLDSARNVIVQNGPCGTGGGAATPGGSTGQVQYNNGGLFGALTNAQLTADINVFSSTFSGAAPASGGGTTNFLRADGQWAQPAGGVGGGSVSSVGLALPGSLFGIVGSPVTVSGTLTGTLNAQTANTVFAGPTSGSAVPTFRALVAADLPASGATAGSYTNINATVDTTGRITAVSNGTGGSGVPGGSNGQVQVNNSGVFGGLTNTQLTALVNPFTASLPGAAPASGGGTSNFLRADGAWALPTATGSNTPTKAISCAATTYTVLSGDNGQMVTFCGSVNVAVTLPTAGSTGFASTWGACLQNNGSGIVTVTPVSGTFNLQASIAIGPGQEACPVSDGTNYAGFAPAAVLDEICSTWDSTTAVTAQTIDFPMPWNTYTLTGAKAKTAGGGSFTYTFKIGGVTVTGLSAVTVNSASNVTTAATALNTGVANDIISLLIASPSGTVNQAYVCLTFKRPGF